MPDDFDSLLNKALSDYARAPERIGLEQRIAARINKPRRRQFNWGRVTVAVVGIVLAVSAGLFWTGHKSGPPPGPVLSMTTPPAVQAPSPPVNVVVQPARSVRHHHKVAEPKLARFPVPSPLTNEERALLQMARLDPKYIPVELTHPDQPIKPVEVAPVKVEPINKEE